MHAVTIDAGALSDTQSTPIAAYAGQFTLDRKGPRVVDVVGLRRAGSCRHGDFVYTVTFNEPLLSTSLDATDFTLVRRAPPAQP